MSEFNISEYDEINLLENNTTKKNNKAKTRPKWLEKSNKRQNQLYDLVCFEFKKIKKDIKKGLKLKVNQRKIRIAEIAKQAGVTRGYITPSKTEEICDLINKRNRTLSKIWVASGNNGRNKNITKAELTKKYSKCRIELNDLIDEKTSDVISELYKTSLNETRQNLKKQLCNLQHDYDELFDKSNLYRRKADSASTTNIRLSEANLKLKREVRKLKKEIMALKSK